MPPTPPPTTPEAPSESTQLLRKICSLFGDEEEVEGCLQRVEAMRARGIDDLFIGKLVLQVLENKVLDELKESVASPARKREMLMMEMLEMLEK